MHIQISKFISFTGKDKMETFARHREKLKKISKTTTGQSHKTIKSWKYMSHIKFLLLYMTNTERDTNVSSNPDISISLEETASTEDSRDYSLVETSTKKRNEIVHDEDSLLNFLKEINENRDKRTAQTYVKKY